MNRYRLEVAASFEPPAGRSQQRRFAETMRAAYNSQLIQETEVELGPAIGDDALVRLSVEADTKEEAAQTARREIERVAAGLGDQSLAVREIRVVNCG
jgi:hypothetical protein